MNNPYTVLGISKNATDDEIKKAFRKLAKATHPDVNGGNQKLTEKFREVAEAYTLLSDPIQRRFWDDYENDNIQEDISFNNHFEFSNVKIKAEEIEFYIHMMYDQMKPYKEAATKSILVGLAWLFGGLIITYASYSAAVSNGGGTYFITWGAIIFGGYQAIRSFMYYSEINSALEEAESKIWNQFR